jgi:hypothetical protein
MRVIEVDALELMEEETGEHRRELGYEGPGRP